MFAEFRSQYPKGSIKTEMLAKIDGMHTFRAEISNEGVILATAVGCDPDLETAEDRAIKRALAIAGISENYRLEYQSYAQIETSLPHDPPRLQQSYAEPPTPTNNKRKSEPPESPVDLSDLIAQTDVEMQRAGWSREKGKEYLLKTFGKASRQRLTAKELQQFLNHLRSLPSYIETYPQDQEF